MSYPEVHSQVFDVGDEVLCGIHGNPGEWRRFAAASLVNKHHPVSCRIEEYGISLGGAISWPSVEKYD